MSRRQDAGARKFFDKQRQEKERKTQLPGEDEPPLPDPVEPIHADKKNPGRNDPCNCGSGKKYKQCCGKEA